MKVMRAVQRTSTCQLPSGKHQRSTMYPASRILHSIPIQLHHAVWFNLTSGWYTESLHIVLPMTVIPQKKKLWQLWKQLLMPSYTSKKMMKKTSKWYLWMTNIGTTEEVPDRTLCICEHALPHRLCPYPCPYANYLLPSYADTMDLNDIPNFEDIMIKSSDEDIPALEDAPYWETMVCIEHYIDFNLFN